MLIDYLKKLFVIFTLSLLVVGCATLVEEETEDSPVDIPESAHEFSDLEDSEARDLEQAIIDIQDESFELEDLGLDIFE